MSDDNGQCFSNDIAVERSDDRNVIATVSQTPIDDNGQCFSNGTTAERSDGRSVIATVSQTPIDDVLHCEICDVKCRGNLGLSFHQPIFAMV